jgi:GNAT superfamily N-acetyltransferase
VSVARPPSWTVRRLREEDVEQVRRLAAEVFFEQPPDRFSAEYWNWEFEQAPAGRSSAWIADDAGRAVGHYAAVPLTYTIDGRAITGAIVVDVMSDSDYRNQGMFTALGRSAVAEVGEDGISFVVGYPVRPEVMPGHLKVGWVHAFDLPVYALPLKFESALTEALPTWAPAGALAPVARAGYRSVMAPALRRRFSAGTARRGSVVLREVTELDEGVDALADAVAAGHRVVLRRDLAYLRWRYLKHPRETYRIVVAEEGERLVGLSVTRPGELLGIPALVLVDLAVVPGRPDVVAQLVDGAVAEGRERGSELVATMLNAQTQERRAVQSRGFLRTPAAFHYIVRPTREDVDRSVLMDPRSWWVTWGDTDVL